MSDITMRGPKGCANTLSFGGQSYSAKKGLFTVPAEAAEHLKRHGFTVDGEEVAEIDEQRAAREAAEAEAAEAERVAREAEETAAREAAEAAAKATAGGKQP